MPFQYAAFFDVDHTLVPKNTMERVFLPFLLKRRYLRTRDLARYLGSMAKNLNYLDTEFIHRNKSHFKYKDPSALDQLAAECFQTRILPLVSPEGRRTVEEHRKAGHLVVILTGSLQPLADQLCRELHADLVLASQLAVEHGAFNGDLARPRPYGQEKARLVRQLAESCHLDLSGSFAYGDHHSDLELLACVGNPRVVNPDHVLWQEAKRRGWPILKF